MSGGETNSFELCMILPQDHSTLFLEKEKSLFCIPRSFSNVHSLPNSVLHFILAGIPERISALCYLRVIFVWIALFPTPRHHLLTFTVGFTLPLHKKQPLSASAWMSFDNTKEKK